MASSGLIMPPMSILTCRRGRLRSRAGGWKLVRTALVMHWLRRRGRSFLFTAATFSASTPDNCRRRISSIRTLAFFASGELGSSSFRVRCVIHQCAWLGNAPRSENMGGLGAAQGGPLGRKREKRGGFHSRFHGICVTHLVLLFLLFAIRCGYEGTLQSLVFSLSPSDTLPFDILTFL